MTMLQGKPNGHVQQVSLLRIEGKLCVLSQKLQALTEKQRILHSKARLLEASCDPVVNPVQKQGAAPERRVSRHTAMRTTCKGDLKANATLKRSTKAPVGNWHMDLTNDKMQQSS